LYRRQPPEDEELVRKRDCSFLRWAERLVLESAEPSPDDSFSGWKPRLFLLIGLL
jgi:hypothetical protein